MNLPPFYIGQKVVCVEPSEKHGLFMNKKYKITRLIECSECGKWRVEYGISTGREIGNNTCCGVSVKPTGFWCANASRFRAIEEKPQYMTFTKIQELEKTEVLINN